MEEFKKSDELKKEDILIKDEELENVVGAKGYDVANPAWICQCGYYNSDTDNYCRYCQQPRPEEDDSYGCILKGTMITMADGTEKAVEDIRTGDLVRSWNFEKGAYVDTEILHPFHLGEEPKIATVIDAVFSDGTKIPIVNKHGFFDLNLGRYVEFDKNAKAFIGHDFVKVNGDEWTKVRLQDISIREEKVEAYAPVAKGTLNCYTNGLLSIPGYCTMLYNFFDVNVATLTWENMEADLNKYGLLPYEQVKHLCTKPTYDAFNAKWFSISFGKGHCSLKELENVVESVSSDLQKIQLKKKRTITKEELEQSQLKDKDLKQVFGGNGDFGGEGDVIPEGSQSRLGFIVPEDSDVLYN